MPALILGGMALAVMIAILVVVVASVRRKEASPLLAVGAFAGVIWIALLPLGAALEGGVLDPLLGPHPDNVRHRFIAALDEVVRVGVYAAGCAMIAWAVFTIGAALAMLPRLRAGRALRLAALARRGSPEIPLRWDELPLRIRLRVWAGYLVAGAAWIGFGTAFIAFILEYRISSRLVFWAMLLLLLTMSLVDLQLWYYGRLARKMGQAPAAGHTAAPSPPRHTA
ncbi:MAG: hypothetical protein JSV65_04210 [Armatimonadota bacterium]|nr:MAG: hypothetical protein JSV65_04210 [Armatimonadota bacterium]